MKKRFNFSKLKENSSSVRSYALDLFMIILAFLYLAWSLFDILIRTNVLTNLLYDTHWHWVIDLHQAYVSLDSIFYDSVFVSIFISELLLRWGLAIYHKTYHRWFFYPFVHWYDTLGCIPVTSFKFFRVLRIFFVVGRMHKEQVLDLSGTFVFEIFRKYSRVLVEEVSDRVVINIINGMQTELQQGTPITDRVIQEVISPHKPALVEWLSHRVQHVASETEKRYGTDLRTYIDQVIEESVHQNREVSNIERIPIVGTQFGSMLEHAISDIVYQVVARLIKDLSSPNNREILGDVADLAIDTVLFQEEDAELDRIVKDLTHQSLEMLKAQVKVQQWKEEEN